MLWRSWLLALSLFSPIAWAGDALTDAIQKAYVPYRVALFATNTGSVEQSVKAVDTAQAQWAHVLVEYGDLPPAPYDRDKQLNTTFKAVAEAYAKAQDQVQAGHLPAAHDTLEQIRDLLSDLRARNHVIVFSDRMNAYHAELEHMITDGPAWLKEKDGMAKVQSQAGVLSYLVVQLETHASPALAQEPAFQSALADLKHSVQALVQAATARDNAEISKAIAGLKKPYSKLFLQFG